MSDARPRRRCCGADPQKKPRRGGAKDWGIRVLRKGFPQQQQLGTPGMVPETRPALIMGLSHRAAPHSSTKNNAIPVDGAFAAPSRPDSAWPRWLLNPRWLRNPILRALSRPRCGMRNSYRWSLERLRSLEIRNDRLLDRRTARD